MEDRGYYTCETIIAGAYTQPVGCNPVTPLLHNTRLMFKLLKIYILLDWKTRLYNIIIEV